MKSRKEMLEEFLAADPNDSFSRYALALELEKAGQLNDAMNQLQEVIRRDENYVAAYYHLGRMLANTNAEAQAREIYQRGLAVAAKAGDQKTRNEIQEAIAALD
ncbi:MAG: tetratricopeptide repeat protein [Acidobacteriota bacterium]